jgi:hypothetical protein
LDSVVAIGFGDVPAVRWSATGFLYGKRTRAIDETTSAYRAFLVTNRHVLQGQMAAVLRFNPEALEPAQEFRLDLTDADGGQIWMPHADADVDLATFPLPGAQLKQSGVRISLLRDAEDCLFREQALSAGLAEGDAVFVLGFPMGLVGGSRSFAIVRQGIIARVRDWLAGASKELLLDASIFPGNSEVL